MGRKMRMSIYIEKNEDTNMSYFQIDFFFFQSKITSMKLTIISVRVFLKNSFGP